MVKNTLTERAADKAGAEDLKELLEGPTAFTFVRGDAALAAKALATFRREHELLEFKGGTMDGDAVIGRRDRGDLQAARPRRAHGQLVGVLASPITGLVRGLNQLIEGLAQQLGQIAEQGLVSGEAPAGRGGACGRGARRRAEEAPPQQEARRRGAPPRKLKASDAPGRGAKKPIETCARAGRAGCDEQKRGGLEMADQYRGKWIDELKGISVLELSERIKALEEAFGVSATAVAAAAPGRRRCRRRRRGRGGESARSTSCSPAPATRRSR